MSGRDDSALAERLRGYLAVADAASAAMGAVREAGPTKYADRTIDERCAWLDAHDAENGAWDRLTEWAHGNAEDLARWALAEHERAERLAGALRGEPTREVLIDVWEGGYQACVDARNCTDNEGPDWRRECAVDEAVSALAAPSPGTSDDDRKRG